MKKFPLLAAALTLSAAVGCGGSSPASNLNGTPAEIMDKLNETVSVAGPVTFDSPLTAENAPVIGLTPEEFDKYVTDAVLSTAAISTFAYETALISAKDSAAAAQVKKLIAAGYDSKKWICVFPEKSCVAESGNYVLLAAGRGENVDALFDAFTELAGVTGDRDVFFAGLSDGATGGGTGGMILPR